MTSAEWNKTYCILWGIVSFIVTCNSSAESPGSIAFWACSAGLAAGCYAMWVWRHKYEEFTAEYNEKAKEHNDLVDAYNQLQETVIEMGAQLDFYQGEDDDDDDFEEQEEDSDWWKRGVKPDDR